ncbi:hypothetical protein [Thermococcus sp.]|uniref:hypothetical protein n=1 Tax=Thermococcus sp. TaxID=35749 RepID=UPI00261D249A|nr:hypothetical protein [Thermococcus sp.]
MKLIIKPEKGFGKIKVELDGELVGEIERLSERYGVPAEKIIEMALKGEFRESHGELEELEEKTENLEKRVWKLEREYSPLRFKAYGLSEDNKVLAGELTSLIAENNQLRRFLGLKPEKNLELRRLISYYRK